MTLKTKKKGRSCTICGHPERTQIEQLRIAGLSLDALAERFSVSRDAIHRHMHGHVTDEQRAAYVFDAPVKEMAARAAAENVTLFDYLSLIRETLMRSMMQAASLNDCHATANLAGRAVDVLREIGRLTGEVSRITSIHQTVNFASTPEFARLSEMLIVRLGPWPEALASVLDGLQHLDASEAHLTTTFPPTTLLGAPSE